MALSFDGGTAEGIRRHFVAIKVFLPSGAVFTLPPVFADTGRPFSPAMLSSALRFTMESFGITSIHAILMDAGSVNIAALPQVVAGKSAFLHRATSASSTLYSPTSVPTAPRRRGSCWTLRRRWP